LPPFLPSHSRVTVMTWRVVLLYNQRHYTMLFYAMQLHVLRGKWTKNRPKKKWIDNVWEDCSQEYNSVSSRGTCMDQPRYRSTVRQSGCWSAGTTSLLPGHWVKVSQAAFTTLASFVFNLSIMMPCVLKLLCHNSLGYNSSLPVPACQYGCWLLMLLHWITSIIHCLPGDTAVH